MPARHTEIIARGVYVRGSRVLLCRSISGEYSYLPGGHVEFGEPAADALVREIAEESGAVARVGELVLVTEQSFRTRKGTPHHEINLVFLVEHLELANGEPATPETLFPSLEPKIAFDWVDLAAVTDLDLRPTEMQAYLASGGNAGASDLPVPGWIAGCQTEVVPPEVEHER